MYYQLLNSKYRILLNKVFRIIGQCISFYFITTILVTIALRWIDPITTSFIIRTKYNRLVGKKSNLNIRLSWIDFEYISPFAGIAIIAAEDQKFLDHSGFDFESISKAREEYAEGGRLRGASTISQQVAKNLFLWQGKSWFRKGIEAYYTILLELFLPKKRILEIYLNIAEFGDYVFGIEEASKLFFNKTPEKLSPKECALFAAVLPNPKRFKANNPSDYILERKEWILNQMDQLGGLTLIEKLE